MGLLDDSAAFNGALDDLLATNREQAAETGQPVSDKPGVGVTAVLNARAEKRDNDAAEQAFHDEQDALEEQDAMAEAEQARFVNELRVNSFLSGEYEPQSGEEYIELLNLCVELDSADEQAEQYSDQHDALGAQQQAWVHAAQQFEHEHPGAGQRFLEALWYGEALDHEHAKQLALADVDLPSSIAHRAQERAGLAETAQQLSAAGWNVAHGDWEDEANLARELSAHGVNPTDMDTMNDLGPHILEHDGNVADAVAAYRAQTAAKDAEYDVELEAYGIDPNSPLAHEISVIASQQTEGVIDQAIAIWRMQHS
jgi:hypothetical protein